MVWEVKTYPNPEKSLFAAVGSEVGAFLNVSEEEMSIRMSRAAAPYWVSFYHLEEKKRQSLKGKLRVASNETQVEHLLNDREQNWYQPQRMT